ncbi:MAG: hypothetical protein GY904_25770 [Planctomycetaceae bacterium]|nr:hypothetical protein [Planctomycetaceae bacterium]
MASMLSVICVACDRESSIVVAPQDSSPSGGASDSLDEAKRLIANRQFDAAREAIQLYLNEHPEDVVGLTMAGDGAMQAMDFEKAAGFYQAAVAGSESPEQELWFKWANATMADERPFSTIAVLRDAVRQYPNVMQLRQNLASFLSRVGMQNEAAEHLIWLVQREHGSLSILLQLSDLTRPTTDEETCRAAILRHPDDLRPAYAIALLDAERADWIAVKTSLDQVLEQHPKFVAALALYGRAIVELDATEQIEKWSQSCPPAIEDQPQYWLAAGKWATKQGSPKQAARAYWCALRLNENDPEALNGLALALSKLGESEQARWVSQRLKNVVALRTSTDQLSTWDFDSQVAAVDLALTLQELGRPWEAMTWLTLASAMTQQSDARLGPVFREIRGGMTVETPWQLASKTVTAKLDLSQWPNIAWQAEREVASPSASINQIQAFRFRDEADARLLVHTCDIGKKGEAESGLMIYQSGAGGAGIIDLDLDGWPDVYLTRMDGNPNQQDSSPSGLYRNLEGTFSDVTERSLLIDHGYAQGMTVADYNSDGWPDIYVANIGENRLYRNNGDGTFSDVTEESRLEGGRWTTSVAMADLNDDGNIDIFEAGYCRGEEPLTQTCPVPSIGEPRSCNPVAFPAEPDQLWLGQADGSFRNETERLATHKPGRGFALVIGDFDQQGGLETYVANDMTGNHFWNGSQVGERFEWTEQAAVRGLAFNGRSIAQASMGIAAADADKDGDIDFFLTHFAEDHNTYYQQTSAGLWSDKSHVAGFAEPSLPMLAYGTQWIDVDNDGNLEVFIANGDIDDFQFQGRSFRQKPQLMAQATAGQWGSVTSNELGKYFSERRLSRAVTVLDANRDGKSDLLVTHLFDPVALLINRTDPTGQQTRFFLRATSTHRDAVGTRIRSKMDGQAVEQQLLAGHGFQCSNEACLAFGGLQAKHLDEVEVLWPSGKTESLGSLRAGYDYLVIEDLGVTRFER